ncbi:unnamed protein product [Rotaria sordida]|uniref:Helix-turn-helix domain-containing protein n=1 Tax=Rotaria sordida TaxID=392033 RepID=A0A814KGZ5_9BILA|nr:unnamed protein product [Rotaria sordida]CAF3924327.1 unnamed protein product [Rotaria sordida]
MWTTKRRYSWNSSHRENEDQDQHVDDDQLSDYFEVIEDMFEQEMQPYLTKLTNQITLDDLRDLAILKHRIAKIDLEKKLWLIYLQFGRGERMTTERMKLNVDRRLWPAVVKKKFHSAASNANDSNTGESEQQVYERKVHQYIEDLFEKIEFYSMEYHEKKTQFIGFTNEMEQAIETFIQHYSIVPFRLKFNYRIAILEFNYDDQLLEQAYLQLKPTKNQIQAIKYIYNYTTAYVQAKQEVFYLKQRLLCNKPTLSFYHTALSFQNTSTSLSMTDPTLYQLAIERDEKFLQQQMTDLVVETIREVERKILPYQIKLNDAKSQLSKSNENQMEILSKEFIDLMNRRLDIIYKKFIYSSTFKMNYFLQHSYDNVSYELNLPSICFSPTMIATTVLHLFSREQLKLLNRGPCYIPPGQLYMLSSLRDINVEKIIEEQYKSIQHDLNRMFAKCEINGLQSMSIRKQIKTLFHQLFSTSSLLPSRLYQRRALYEKQMIDSIRKHLQKYDLILKRVANQQQNVFCLLHRPIFEEKIHNYMSETDMFIVCEDIDDNNLQATRHNLTLAIERMNIRLRSIFYHKNDQEILKKLSILTDKIQLPYLYFLPEILPNMTMTVHPMVAAQNSETVRIAQFLDDVLRPNVSLDIDRYTFVNGTDFIRKLNDYIEETSTSPSFCSTTNFVTITILNFYSMVDHDTQLLEFQHYLKDPCQLSTIKGISIQKIYDLTTLFLRNNRFYYDHKIYRFIKGSPTCFPFSETLATLYVLPWFKSFFRQSLLEKEFYGRYHNQLFFTWNDTKENLIHMIEMANTDKLNIHVDIKMGSNATFLQAYLENQHGTLYSRVHHDSTIQKYTLPYVITGHSKEAHSHWLRTSLLRAVRYCTSVDDFNQERIYLEVTFLANGYTIEFVEKRIEQFFTHFNALSLRSDLDQHVYNKLRLRLFNFINEQKRMIQNYHRLEREKKRFRLSYLYDSGPKLQFNQQLQEIFTQNLNTHDPLSKYRDLQLIVSTKNPYTLNTLLSEYKPSHPLLIKDVK